MEEGGRGDWGKMGEGRWEEEDGRWEIGGKNEVCF